MARHGLSVADIERFIGKKRGRKPGKGAKAAGAKRTVAAKYADPKTGATWTGRGRAPAWIRDVKDRSKFLIDGSAAKPAAKAARKPRVNAAAAKKTVAKRAKAANAKKAARKTA
ncbi:H-NS histone family protein [Paraburkholderia flagellata]|uniref:H-NS histone family protein n=1 Tax=Paraburkholderia flagellata TaxID=2883241 RepID=UPI003571294F